MQTKVKWNDLYIQKRGISTAYFIETLNNPMLKNSKVNGLGDED